MRHVLSPGGGPGPLAADPGDAKVRGMSAKADKRRQEAEGGLLTGQLLIAMPGMNTSHFVQTVIYLCAHTADGAMGLVVNRPLAAPSFDDLLQQLDVAPVPPARRIELFRGGPVDSARGFVLHTTDWTGDGSLLVDDGVALTASLDVLKVIAEGGGPARGLLALGYAGWGPGQLDEEMTRHGWFAARSDHDLLFDTPADERWAAAFAKEGIDPRLLVSETGLA